MNRTRSILSIALLAAVAFGLAAHAASPPFSADLKAGMTHPQVLELQKVLNRDPVTRIAAAGAGSPGAETAYFGQLTKQAVIRFQEKYSARILAPAGLSSGTGFVGTGTRAVLNELDTATSTVTPLTITPAPVPPPLTATATTSVSVNPNAAQIDNFVAAVHELGKKQGMDSAKLASVEQAMRTIAATSTDLTREFMLHSHIKEGSMASDTESLGWGQRLLAMLGLYTPALAGEGVHFGGALLSAVPCTCAPDVWLIFLEPLPPSYAAVLSYIGESQMYASYNTPLTTHLLGVYEPGVPSCYMYAGVTCVPAPQEGTITPMLGSAPL